MKSICVIGSTSFLGKSICASLKNKYAIIKGNSKNCNVIDNDCVQNFFKPIKYLHGLIYCSALKTDADALADKQVLKEILEVNLFGAISCMQIAAKKINIKKIVIIGSADGTFGNFQKTMYSVSKSALHQYTKCFATQLKSEIETICLVPGTIKNNSDKKAISDFILSFMNDDIRNIHGQLIRIDGGHHTFAI